MISYKVEGKEKAWECGKTLESALTQMSLALDLPVKDFIVVFW